MTRTKNRAQNSLLSRWPLILGLGLVGGAAALAWTWNATAVHRVRAQLLLPPTPDQFSPGSILLSGSSTTPLSILHGMFASDAMAYAVSKEFAIPESELHSMWFVRSDPLTNQIELIVDSPSPERASQIVQFSIAEARQLELQASTSAAGTRATQLRDALDGQLERTKSIEAQFRQTLVAARVMSGSEGAVAESQGRLSGLESELAAKLAERRVLASKLRRGIAEPELPKSGELDVLRVRVHGLREEIRSAEERLGAEAPELANLRNQLSIADDLYGRELSRLRDSVKAGISSQVAELDARIANLQYRVSHQREMHRESPTESAKLHTAQSRLQQAYATAADLRTRFEQARVDAEVERVDWNVLTPAFVEERAINKRWVRNPAAGTVLGMLIGCLIAFWTPRKPRRASKEEIVVENEWNNAA